jgi:hypothetical protein
MEQGKKKKGGKLHAQNTDLIHRPSLNFRHDADRCLMDTATWRGGSLAFLENPESCGPVKSNRGSWQRRSRN